MKDKRTLLLFKQALFFLLAPLAFISVGEVERCTSGEPGEIEVLGTHFDVNDYSDENEVKTTLLEGSVKIKSENQVQMLTPGQ